MLAARLPLRERALFIDGHKTKIQRNKTPNVQRQIAHFSNAVVVLRSSGISVSLPFSQFMLAPQQNVQIISITGGAAPAIYFRDQKTTLDKLGPLLDAAKRENRSIIIKADRFTPYDLVVAVTNATLAHGITSVALATAALK